MGLEGPEAPGWRAEETQPLSEPGCGVKPGAGCSASRRGPPAPAQPSPRPVDPGKPLLKGSNRVRGVNTRSSLLLAAQGSTLAQTRVSRYGLRGSRAGKAERERTDLCVRKGPAVCAASGRLHLGPGTSSAPCILAWGAQPRCWGAERRLGLQKARGEAVCRQEERKGIEGREASTAEAETKRGERSRGERGGAEGPRALA